MFFAEEDLSLHITRGDTGELVVRAVDETTDGGETPYIFKAGDVLRLKVYEKKNCDNVVLQKDFGVEQETEIVSLALTEIDTRIGDTINKPVDYWYEIELNPFTEPQTIVGYDDDGAKLFRLYPEGKDTEVIPPTPEEVGAVDSELSLTSEKAIQNQAVARAIAEINSTVNYNNETATEEIAKTTEKITKTKEDVALLNARVNNLAKLNEGSTTGDAELQDIRVGYDGKTYTTAGEAVREQVNELNDDVENLEKTLENVIPSTMFNIFIGNETSIRRDGYWKNDNGVAVYIESGNYLRAVNPQDIEGCYKVYVKNLNQNALAIADDGFRSIMIVDEDYNVLEEYTNQTNGYFEKELFIPYTAKYLLLNYFSVSNNLQFDGYQYNKTVDKDGVIETLLNNLIQETNGNRFITFDEYDGNKWWTSNGNKIESQENQHNNAKRAVITVNQGSFYKVIYGLFQFSISNKTAMYLCDDDGNVIKTYDIYPDNIFSIPFGVTKIYINFWISSNPPQSIIEYSNNCLLNKNVAIIGDSISTNGINGTDANAVEITISESDVGQTLSAYPTMYDVNNGLSLGGHTFTASDVGEEYEFIPTADDVGKVIGIPKNYNANSLTTWWEFAKEYFGFNAIPVCWSGSSIARHENEVANPELKCSYAWHESQIRKCGIRKDGTMERTAPDVIIVYRGCNDMTHSPYSRLTNGYFDNPTFDYPTNDTLEDGTHGFKEAYVLLISKLRKAYPNAKIILCTLAVFKRINYSHFPTNNGLYTLPQMNNAIREIADYMGCGLIEFDKCGITFENCYTEGYITDSATTSTHPSLKGHYMMAVKAISDLKNL